VHWPDIDEDISVEGMLHGTPARRPKPARPSTKGAARQRKVPNQHVQPPRKKSARG
jgi:hypothetical protein